MQEQKYNGGYVRPPVDLLCDYPEGGAIGSEEVEKKAQTILRFLENHKIACKIAGVYVGASVTRYDVALEDNLLIKQALRYSDELAVELQVYSVRLYLNYPNGCVSVEVPNSKKCIVGLKNLLLSEEFKNTKAGSLRFALGRDIDGRAVCPDITKMPHLLMAGTTGAGKSICINSLLASLTYAYGPEELRLILVDPKQCELIAFNRLPHLLTDVISDVEPCIKALKWAICEMERRYDLFKELTEKGLVTRSLDEYNENLPLNAPKLPKILIVIDELGDLMPLAKKDIEAAIIRLAQKARASGIHLIVSTQRPSVDVITGMIKYNLSTRICFKTFTAVDSMTVLDEGGAESLVGMGDLLFRTADTPDLKRVQCCYISFSELQKVVNFVADNNPKCNRGELTELISKVEEKPVRQICVDDENEADDSYITALKYCVDRNQASVSLIQRRFPIGYIKACKMIDWMENMNYITPSVGIAPRKVLLTAEKFKKLYGYVDYNGGFSDTGVKGDKNKPSCLFTKDDGAERVYISALKFCIANDFVSVAAIQRRFPVNYLKACKIVDWMERLGYITSADGSAPAKIKISLKEFTKLYGEVDDD